MIANLRLLQATTKRSQSGGQTLLPPISQFLASPLLRSGPVEMDARQSMLHTYPQDAEFLQPAVSDRVSKRRDNRNHSTIHDANALATELHDLHQRAPPPAHRSRDASPNRFALQQLTLQPFVCNHVPLRLRRDRESEPRCAAICDPVAPCERA